jgi:hypothetical protein
MPVNRFLLMLAVAALIPWLAWAQIPGRPPTPIDTGKSADAQAKDAPPTEAEQLIDAAIEKLKAIQAVEADVVQDVVMLGQSFQIKGSYLKGAAYQVRLELNLVGLADVDGTMLQVCDGQTLWDFQKISNAQNYRRLGIDRILKRIQSPDFDPEIRDRVISQFGFSGPEALLVGLRKAILFDQKEEDEFEGQRVWVLRGTWKDREALTGPSPGSPIGPLPPYIPSVAALTLGREDGWPYRLELKGRIRPSQALEPKSAVGSASSSARQEQISTITLRYSNVRLNAEIDPSRFAFQAPDPRVVPNVVVVDQTEDFLAELEKIAQQTQLAKKAEAAAKEAPQDGLFTQPIPVPRTTPAPGEPVPKSP